MRSQQRLFLGIATFAALFQGASSVGFAQFGGRQTKPETPDSFVKKVMAFDKNSDGKLTKKELVDRRLHHLFERANTKKRKYITSEDLKALYKKEHIEGGNRFGRGPGGPGGPGGGPGRFGPPRPGEILPAFVQTQLKLTDKQKKQISKLQKEVNAKLEKILTKSQRERLSQMRRRRPGGGRFGPPGRDPGDRPPGRPQPETRPRDEK